jgi:hypothetical protein
LFYYHVLYTPSSLSFLDMFRNLPGFKSLPSAIGLPFLSSQEDAQLKFRSGENGIKRLYGDEVVPLSDYTYWAQYYSLFSSAQDVYSLISVQDGRFFSVSSCGNRQQVGGISLTS